MSAEGKEKNACESNTKESPSPEEPEKRELPCKPTALRVNPEGIPQELKERRQWLVWRYEYRFYLNEALRLQKAGRSPRRPKRRK